MSSIGNTVKSYSFAVDIDGIPQLTVQKISGLEVEIERVAHGEGKSDVFTPGRTKYGTVTMEHILPVANAANKIWELITRARTLLAGEVGQTITIRMVGADDLTTLKTWVLKGAWCFKSSYGELSRMSSDNLVRTAEWSVDEIIEL